MEFSADLESFLKQLSTLQGKMFLIACLGLGFIGYWLLVFALTYPAQVYSGGFS